LNKEKIYKDMKSRIKDVISHLERAYQGDCVDDIFLKLARDDMDDLNSMFDKIISEIKCADG